MNKIIEQEIGIQNEYLFTYKAINAAVFGVVILFAANGHDVIALTIIFAQIAFNAVRVPVIIAKFDERIKHLTFKTQIENIYVFSLSDDHPDDTVADTFAETINYLKQTGNKHEPRVHMIMFRDVTIFTAYVDANGRIIRSHKPRDPLSSCESWDQYMDSIEQFRIVDRDERLRQLRKDNAGFEWVNENLFGQWSREK